MYKLLLCWRYLLTRYLALACIISVMLGVATLILVNSVMSGFSTKLRDRLHGVLSDIVIESDGLEGFANPQLKMAKILQDPFLKDQIVAMTPTMEVFAMLQYSYPNGEILTRPVRLIGINIDERGKVGGFNEFLVNDKKSRMPATFEPSEEAKKRFADREKRLAERRDFELQQAHQIEVFRWREEVARLRKEGKAESELPPEPLPAPMIPALEAKTPQGAIIGKLLVSFRQKDPEKPGEHKELFLRDLGDSVILTTVGGQKLNPVYDSFIVTSYFNSEMSEYDSQYVYVPLSHLQHLRSLPDRVTSLQIKIKDYTKSKEIVEKLSALFAMENLRVETWEMKQGALLAAISVERGILNILLFLIIAVAGFGILAIFSMIVAEKTKDIGILKALGAPSGGVMKIFLGYGLLLGIVGAGLGSVLGLSLTIYINNVEKFLTTITGQEIFDRTIYYFAEIPTNIQPTMVILVNLGAIGIAVAFSVLPALRAALLHPVRALRYE